MEKYKWTVFLDMSVYPDGKAWECWEKRDGKYVGLVCRQPISDLYSAYRPSGTYGEFKTMKEAAKYILEEHENRT